MNNLKEKALNLRKLNKSYSEIHRELGIAKSTLSNWFKSESFSTHIKNQLIKKTRANRIKNLKLMAIANKEKWRKIHENYREKARIDFPKILKEKYFIPGIFIYWGEGDKKLTNSTVRMSNTDERMLKIYIKFLVEVCKISPEKIRVWLLLYPDLNDVDCKYYWSKTLSIPISQFCKSQYILGREKRRKVNNGVCSIEVYSRELKEKILEWIDLYSKMNE